MYPIGPSRRRLLYQSTYWPVGDACIAVRPFQRFPFDFAHGFPRPDLVDHLGFEQANDALGQRIVVGVANGSNREIDLGLSQPLGIRDGQVLRSRYPPLTHAAHVLPPLFAARSDCRATGQRATVFLETVRGAIRMMN
jgi:hypothetical protein